MNSPNIRLRVIDPQGGEVSFFVRSGLSLISDPLPSNGRGEFPSTSRKGLPLINQLIVQVRRELFPLGVIRRRVTQTGELSEVRPTVVEKLVAAINVVEGLAKSSGKRSKRGTGGVSPKARWYQLMAYLAQTLDGVLRNVELEKVREKLEQLEMTVDELQRTSPQAGG